MDARVGEVNRADIIVANQLEGSLEESGLLVTQIELGVVCGV